MSCSSPLYRIPWDTCSAFLPDSFERRVHNGGIIIGRDERDQLCAKRPIFDTLFQKVPCGKCIMCRLDYSRDWANRCMLEAREHKYNQFVTLTYDMDHLPPFKPFIDMETGVVELRSMLVKEHLSKFMKDLRRYFSYHFDHDDIRFFGCGEYGEKSFRPHFHLQLFNCDFPDKKLWAENPGGRLYTSKILSDIWQNGIAVTADVSWNTAAYTARYVMKKQKGPSKRDFVNAMESYFPGQPWQEEFVLMSRRPGIARNYYEEHKNDIYATDEIFVPKSGNILPVRPCRYYDKLYDVEYPEEMTRIKTQRQIQGINAQRSALASTDLSELELLASQERAKIAQADRLVRPIDF